MKEANLQDAVRRIYSHTQVLIKNQFLIELILRLNHSLVVALLPVLKKLSNLFNPEIEPLGLCVRQVLNKMHETNYGEMCSNVSIKKN